MANLFDSNNVPFSILYDSNEDAATQNNKYPATTVASLSSDTLLVANSGAGGTASGTAGVGGTASFDNSLGTGAAYSGGSGGAGGSSTNGAGGGGAAGYAGTGGAGGTGTTRWHHF